MTRTDLRNLIEYSRLYVTTFPCHSCARHIVASGIEQVIYIEPYTKSLALELHADSVTQTDDTSGRVRFLQYEGVAPKNVVRLFKNGIERKFEGELVHTPPSEAHPVFPSPLDGFATREQIVVDKIKGLEEGKAKGNEATGEKQAGAAQLNLGASKPE